PRYFSGRDLFGKHVSTSVTRTVAQVTVKRHTRIDRERFIQHEVKSLTRWRVQVEVGDCAADGVQQLWPRLQGFRSNAPAASLWFTFRTSIKEGDPRSTSGEQFRREGTGRSGANNQHIVTIERHKGVYGLCVNTARR